MSRRRIVVERAAHAVVQDLGRPGYAAIGVSPGGASDQHSARVANLLVGNAETAALIEVTGSELVVHCDSATLIAVTGATDVVIVDGHAHPAWELVPVEAGSKIRVPPPTSGLRTYLAFNGVLDATVVLDSVAPDRLLGVGRALAEGDELVLDSQYDVPLDEFLPVFRLGARRPHAPVDGVASIDVTLGPDLDRLTHGADDLAATYNVLPDSDHVGLRLDGPPVTLETTTEILSRGVPIGAVQVPHSGGLIVLMRGRLVTAGYPVVAVATTVALDALGQLRPGDALQLALCSADEAVAQLRRRDTESRGLRQRVRTALTARGLARALDHPTDHQLEGALA